MLSAGEMQTLYCSFIDATDLLTNLSQDPFTGSNDTSRSNATDPWPTDSEYLVERRATEAVYLVVRYYVYRRVTPAIMLVGIVGNLLSLLLGVRCRPQMSSLDSAVHTCSSNNSGNRMTKKVRLIIESG